MLDALIPVLALALVLVLVLILVLPEQRRGGGIRTHLLAWLTRAPARTATTTTAAQAAGAGAAVTGTQRADVRRYRRVVQVRQLWVDAAAGAGARGGALGAAAEQVQRCDYGEQEAGRAADDGAGDGGFGGG